jgi:Flp pilus assembly protein TadG
MSRPGNRRGAAAVEFALVAPLFVLLLLGIIEFGRAMMVQQVLTNATREGARQATLPEATATSVQNTVVAFLSDASIRVSADDVTVTPAPETAFNNEQITVSVQVPYKNVSWIPSSFITGNLSASTKMRSERLE